VAQRTNIIPKADEPGYRDIMIISFNDWERRRYGEEFERNLGMIKTDQLAAS